MEERSRSHWRLDGVAGGRIAGGNQSEGVTHCVRLSVPTSLNSAFPGYFNFSGGVKTKPEILIGGRACE